MPFTPFHFGPGLAFKAIGGKRFSFLVFAGSQILMDIEPLIGILQHKPILHGYTHTLLGAFIIGTFAGIMGKAICPFLFRIMAIPHRPYTWLASLAGAYIGTFSHILLDAIMHADMSPWWPIAPGNQLLRVISVEQLHVACLIAGIIGIIGIIVRSKFDTSA